ncbi:MAG: hypothetical protein KDD41_10845 [Flavobacteriales bacterium]|nr:hypothetical protein [Flavobacteriales bacterium]
MKDVSLLTSGIRQKVEKLIAKQSSLQSENTKLSEQIIKIKQELEEKSQRISELEDKVNMLKIAGSVDSESTKEVKLKINEMVREIDKCIAQINR